MIIIDGKEVAKTIRTALRKKIEAAGITPGLAFVLIGDDPGSKAYVRMKKKGCLEVGIASYSIDLPADVSEQALLDKVRELNNDPSIHGIIVQQPLPKHINTEMITLAIDPAKDVDGFHPTNMGKVLIGDSSGFVPCTPAGIIQLLKAYDISTSGQRVVVIGRSNIVGKPLAALFLQRGPFADATVTVVHSKTKNLPSISAEADILIAALGSPHFVKASMVKENAVVIDVGINRIEREGKTALVGDIDFDDVSPKCSYITPVPGGVGPMTIAMLLSNTVDGCLRTLKNNEG